MELLLNLLANSVPWLTPPQKSQETHRRCAWGWSSWYWAWWWVASQGEDLCRRKENWKIGGTRLSAKLHPGCKGDKTWAAQQGDQNFPCVVYTVVPSLRLSCTDCQGLRVGQCWPQRAQSGCGTWHPHLHPQPAHYIQILRQSSGERERELSKLWVSATVLARPIRPQITHKTDLYSPWWHHLKLKGWARAEK